MHKITKGLKKKKKNKKHKKGEDDDLFDSAELEKYRQQKESAGEQQQEGEASSGLDNDEWKQFKALTAGVDSVLKKTQGDLDRIKSTSFFQRKPPGTPAEEPGKGEQPKPEVEKKKKGKRWVGFEEGSLGIDAPPPEELEDDSEEHAEATVDELLGAEPVAEEAATAVEVEEDQEEEEDEDDIPVDEDIFDTSYVDVITSGEVKLAYIPDSPTEEEQDFDPFDTSIADKVIHEPEDESGKKKKKLVSLGCAVDVLTGKLEKVDKVPPEAVASPGKKHRSVRRRPRNVDLLLGSFDEDGTALPPGEQDDVDLEGITPTAPEQPRSLLDEEPALDIPVVTPLEDLLGGSSGPALTEASAPQEEKEEDVDLKHLVAEFDLIASTPDTTSQDISKPSAVADIVAPLQEETTTEKAVENEDDLEDEFAALAAESVAKKPVPPPPSPVPVSEEGADPFDTTAAAVVLGEPQEEPCDPFNVGPQPPDTLEFSVPVKPGHQFPISPDVDIVLSSTRTTDQSWTNFEEEVQEQEKAQTQPQDDLAILALAEDLQIDPFDTSFAENILPGKAELKLIENEILGDLEVVNEARILSRSDSDSDFNPRAEECKHQTVQSTVSIHITDPAGQEQGEEEDTGLRSLTLGHRDLLGGSTTDLSKLGHDPIQPAAPQEEVNNVDENLQQDVDPFDTSVVEVLAAPGKAELKFLEKELLGSELEESQGLIRTLSDPDFDPRAEEKEQQQQPLPVRPDLLIVNNPTETTVVGVTKTVAFDLPTPSSRPDLLAVGEDEQATTIRKPLTPYHVDVKPADLFVTPQTKDEGDGSSDVDPFDTSFAENILPGKAELKLIESELVGLKHSISDPDFNPRDGEPEPTQPQQVSTNNIQAANIGRRFSDLTGDRQQRRQPPTFLPIRTVTEVTPVEKPEEKQNPAPNIDLLVVEDAAAVPVKPLTPAVESRKLDDIDYVDPFDTSIANNILPGKAELKVLESELINTSLKRSYTDPDFNPRGEEEEEVPLETPDLLNLPTCAQVADKALTPIPHIEEEQEEQPEIDPFDTSIANDIAPGKAELRALESELIG